MTAEKTVLVPLGADETFALLTQPERLRRWQAVTARVELRAGGEYRWTITPGHSAAGTITELEPGKRLVFTWGWEGSEDLPPGTSTVTITLEPAEGGTKVRLVHSGLTPEQAAGHLEGWSHYGDRLVAAAERGDAGADSWMSSEPTDPLTAAEAALAVCQLVLRDLPPECRRRPDSVRQIHSRRPGRAPARVGPIARFGCRGHCAGLRGCPLGGPSGRRRTGGSGGLAHARPRRQRQSPLVGGAGRGRRQHPRGRVPGARLGRCPRHGPDNRGRRRAEPIRSRAREVVDQTADARRRSISLPRSRSGRTPTTSVAWSRSPDARAE